MFHQPNAKAATQHESHTGCLNWAVEHPGMMALGALLVAILALSKSLKIREIETDTGDEEVPLFI